MPLRGSPERPPVGHTPQQSPTRGICSEEGGTGGGLWLWHKLTDTETDRRAQISLVGWISGDD